MKHPSTIEKYQGSLEELATDLGNLRYDALEDFLNLLANKIHLDGNADLGRGRKKLANRLYQAAKQIQSAAQEIQVAWDISEPYMKKDQSE